MARAKRRSKYDDDEDERPSFDPKQREIAWKAISAFRAMLPQLRSFARAISQNHTLDVQITTEKPYTRGNVIYIQPPLELGRDHVHERTDCGRRAANGRQLCPACKVQEVITFFVMHEIGHVYFNSQMPVTPAQKRWLNRIAKEWHPTEVCDHLAEITASYSSINPLASMQLLASLNQYLPMIFNCFEDTRVNDATFRARPGLRMVFDVNIERLMEEGSETATGDIRRWIDEPLDAQFMIGLYLISSGHFVEGRLASSVVDALRTADIQLLCEQAVDCTSASEVFNLSIEAFRAAQYLGYCIVPKCEPVPQLPGQPSDEDEAGDSEEARDGEPTEDSSGSDSDTEDSPEDTDDSEDTDSDSDSSPCDADEEATDEAGDASEDDGEAGEHSDDTDEEVNDESRGTPQDDADGDDGQADEGDRADSDGSDDEGEHSDSAGSEQQQLGSGVPDGDGKPSDGRSSEPGEEEVPPGKQGGPGQLDDADGNDQRETSDGSGMDGEDGDVGQDDESSPVDEDATDAEEADVTLECEHVGEYECTQCGADLTVWDDDAWDTETGDEMTPVDGPSDPVDGLESPTPQHGTPDDAAAALGRFLMHPMGVDELGGLLNDMADGNVEEVVGASEHEAMDELLGKLIEVAMTQSQFFEKDSGIVEGVVTPTYPDRRVLWDIQQMTYELRSSASNILRSVMPDESLIGAATLKMRRLFQDNLMTRRNRNLRSGRLDMRSLARRAPVKDDRLFGKKTKPHGKSYAVVIGIDCSGSTNQYERNLKIKRAAMAQAEVLNRLGISWAGYAHTAFRTPLDNGFTFLSWSGPYYVYLLPFKLANEQWTDTGREKLSAVRALSENLDGHTLEQYLNAVMEMDADERIVIYYTDGEMPAANYDEEREVLIEQCKRAKKIGVHLLGVGINTDSPKQYGMDTVQVDSDEDIHKVIEQLERRLSE